ncbi:uridine kinase [Silvanigrella paludirubra]|uniref:uridine/cytidine kinase n=1 Tax=Silvanigrella paludirubra TaxID=2499159 RepID=A0A6N6VX20_9BACT|nr:uridine kinase [Silvanigrella paludirubra]KAB8037997.1 uridine kinase [Silvanigrella paludirubra]
MKKSAGTTIIAITGGSGSGKTTAARRLWELIGKENCQIISQDSYYHDHSAQFKGDGTVNFDHPNAIDFKLMADHLKKLSQNQPIEIPIYDFVTHTRKEKTIRVEPFPYIIVDGILILSQEILRPFFDFSIFIDISEETRYARRLKRDVEERGRHPDGVKIQFDSFVKPMHETFVQPSKHFATHVSYDNQSLNEMLADLTKNLLSK